MMVNNTTKDINFLTKTRIRVTGQDGVHQDVMQRLWQSRLRPTDKLSRLERRHTDISDYYLRSKAGRT